VESTSFWRIGEHERAIDFDRAHCRRRAAGKPPPWCEAIVSIPETERLNIPPARPRGYAQRMLRRRPPRLREIREPPRTLEILSSLASSQSDVVLQLVEMRINEL